MSKFSLAHSAAWKKIGIGTREKPGEIFPKFKKKDFEDLKADYVKLYGYTIQIPTFDDIIHWKPNAVKSRDEIKNEKKENLVRILQSPAPSWYLTFSTVMTWIDDIQDTASIVFPLVRMFYRVMPKAMSRILPIFGWILLGYDILNFANALGRAPLTPLKSKREVCGFLRHNPFGASARLARIDRIKRWKPGMGDLLQVLQTTDNFTGVGLSFGGIMGAIYDSIFGAYRYVTGEPVKFSFDPPDISTLGLLGSRGLMAAAAISSQDQVFTELTHFWTYQTAAMSVMALAGEFRDNDLGGLVEDPMKMMIPAPEPWDPETISTIKEMGLRVEDGIGWPYNGEKYISLSDYIDATVEPCRANFINYSLRHRYDWYGWNVGAAMSYLIPHTILSIDPEATWEVDDSDYFKIMFRFVKAPLLPTGTVAEEQSNAFWSWVNAYKNLYGKLPGIIEIEERFKNLGIQYATSYPTEEQPGFELYWPEGWRGDESF